MISVWFVAEKIKNMRKEEIRVWLCQKAGLSKHSEGVQIKEHNPNNKIVDGVAWSETVYFFPCKHTYWRASQKVGNARKYPEGVESIWDGSQRLCIEYVSDEEVSNFEIGKKYTMASGLGGSFTMELKKNMDVLVFEVTNPGFEGMMITLPAEKAGKLVLEK